jgi:hypothetical protein
MALSLATAVGCGIPPESTNPTDETSRYLQLRLEKVGQAQRIQGQAGDQFQVVLCQGSRYNFPLPNADIVDNQLPMTTQTTRIEAEKNDSIALTGTKRGTSQVGLRIQERGTDGWRTITLRVAVIECSVQVTLCKGESKTLQLGLETRINNTLSPTSQSTNIASLQTNQEQSAVTFTGEKTGNTEVTLQLQANAQTQPQDFTIQVNVTSCQ